MGVQGMIIFNLCIKKPFPAELPVLQQQLGAGPGAARANTARAEGLEVALIQRPHLLVAGQEGPRAALSRGLIP